MKCDKNKCTMALYSCLFLAYLLFSCSILLCDCLKVDGKENRSFYSFKVGSLAPSTTCYSTEDGRKSTLTVVHRYGPCSPLSSDKLTATQMLEQEQARVDSLQLRISGRSQSQAKVSLEQATVPARSGRSMSTGNFIVTVGFGTPKEDMSLVFDTGSDLTWIQCQPCAGTCYSQQEKIFDPAQSSTYLNVSCSSAECSQVHSATGNPAGCSSSTCVYAVQYGDRSFSIGFLSHEKLTLTSTDVFSNFQFGCGQNNQGLFGTTAGLLGLGRDKISFVSQTAQKYGRVFSYCLPASPSSTGYLTFGGYKPSSAIKFTPLLTDSSNPSFYFLDFIGMAVGGRQLPISSSVFSMGGTLIDSGTVITRLPPSAYTALQSAFKQAMSKYPSSPAVSKLDTCYDFSGFSTVTVPKIVMQFRGGANIDVDVSGILVGVGSSKACLAFAGNSDAGAVTIIGNKQQQTFELIYDVGNARVGFGAGGCS